MNTTRLLAFSTLAALTQLSNAGPGDLDLTFGTGGKVTTAIGSGIERGHGIAVQTDGKIVVAGISAPNMAVLRYNADGSLDTTFNGTGIVIPDFGANASAYSVALQGDGRILVAGSKNTANGSDFAIARFNSDGSLDTNFNGTGTVTTDFGGNDTATSIAVQTNGKIVVTGVSNIGRANFALARYNANGSLDTTLNGTGKVTTDLGEDDIGRGIALQSDGKIVVAGESYNGSTRIYRFALARYNEDGSLDTNFNGTGKMTAVIGSGYNAGFSVALQSDGKIVVAGQSDSGANGYDFAMLRLNSDGNLDPTFNGTGKVTTNIGGYDVANSVALQSDGKLVVGGSSYNGTNYASFAVVRYNPNGSLDPTFNGTGKVTTAITPNGVESSAFGYSLALQSDGKIVVAGQTSNSIDGEHFALVRYEGGPDTTTLLPTMMAPASNSTWTNTVNVSFSTPEAALPGSVKLTFAGTVTRVLTLSAANETAGSHTFTFDARSPLPSTHIADGLPIPDGIYTVTLSYQDFLGNPLATSAPALNVAVNIDTDSDGILDKYETNTGIYASPTDTGTSPTNPDTDADGLNDGVEVHTYLSDPNIADTDGDGFNDGFEASTGFSPTSDASTPDTLSSILTAVEYRFNAANGVSYRIEYSTDLANWSTLESPVIGNGGVITRFYSIEGQPRRFFRSRRN